MAIETTLPNLELNDAHKGEMSQYNGDLKETLDLLESEKVILEEYRKLGEGLKPVEGGDFICIDGKGYSRHGGDVEYIGKRTDRDEFERRKNAVGCYGYNNSVLTYVDGEGRQYVTVWTRKAENALQRAGYKDRGMGIRVPFSNGEEFADESIHEEWEYLWKKSRIERRRSEEQDMLEEYKRLGEGLRQVECGDFICIDDKEYGYRNYEEKYMEKRTDKEVFERRKEAVGCYGYNNGVLTYVDGEGKQYVTVWTREAENALQRAGYKDRGMGIRVPFSNGEYFIDEAIQEEREYLRKKSRVERRRSEEQEMLEEYRRLGEGLKPVEGGEFICIDGKKYMTFLGDKEYVEKRTDKEVFERRKVSVGCYGYNNSVISYVDGEGRQYVTVYTKEASEALEHAGYVYKGMDVYVPFSNGEKFVDESTQEEREYLRKKSKLERIKESK